MRTEESTREPRKHGVTKLQAISHVGCPGIPLWRAFLGVSVSLCLLLSLAACSSAKSVRPENGGIVRPGNAADIRFLCRLQTGEVVVATDSAMGQNGALPKSTVFLPRGKDGSFSVMAGGALPEPPRGKEMAFEDEIINRLAGVIVGMRVGESRTVNLTAEELPERSRDDYVLRVARIRKRPREMRITIDEYHNRTGKSPEVGQPFVFDAAVPGRVEAVTPEEVVIVFSAQPGDVVPTPFGPGHIRTLENNYEIVIDAQKGALVRTGPLVGRIVDVNEQFLIIDYRHPFGGEMLTCDVTVEKTADPEKNAGLSGGE